MIFLYSGYGEGRDVSSYVRFTPYAVFHVPQVMYVCLKYGCSSPTSLSVFRHGEVEVGAGTPSPQFFVLRH